MGRAAPTEDDAQAFLRLSRNDTGAATAGVIGDINAHQEDDAGNDETMVRVRMRSSDVANGSEKGVYEIFVNAAGSLINALTATGGNSANPLSVRVASSLKAVTEGATDSGGSGFKVLRVPN